METPDVGSPDDKARTRKSVLRGTVAAFVCAIGGGALVAMGEESSSLGLTMFLFLPAATGFVTALTADYWKSVLISLGITMVVCLAGLVVTGLEGTLCVVMASPILLVSAMLGAAFGNLVRNRFSSDHNHSLVILPAVACVSVFGIGKIEDRFDTGKRIETFESTILIDATPEDVWDAMIEFDQVEGPQPWLMQIGLPIPQSCSTSGHGVGAERTCRFNSGSIRERVTVWDRPHRLELDIEDVQLPGRHWLGFLQATYTLEEISVRQTRVTRTTTVTSTLSPAFYWRYFEGVGTTTEHDYILHSLKMKAMAAGE